MVRSRLMCMGLRPALLCFALDFAFACLSLIAHLLVFLVLIVRFFFLRACLLEGSKACLVCVRFVSSAF